MTLIDTLRNSFETKFGPALSYRIFQAPGRVNLIGEHTDYNEGFVLPMAINRYIQVAAAPRNDHQINIYAQNFEQWDKFHCQQEIQKLPHDNWANYSRGIAWSLLTQGYDLKGVNAVITGDIPMGSGLSSSAAMEVAFGFALLSISGIEISLTELALLAQKAENDFVGVRCGIMDQFISCLAQADHALLIDCRNLTYRSVAIPINAEIVVVESGVQRQLVEGKYNVRRKECETAATVFGVTKLRDIDSSTFDLRAYELSLILQKRARHVISENRRTLDTAESFDSGDLLAAGRSMQASHMSLRDDFEVSCPELDILFEIAIATQDVYGARITGGGFGGCLVALVESSATNALLSRIQKEYPLATGRQAVAYICQPSAGVTEINISETLNTH